MTRLQLARERASTHAEMRDRILDGAVRAVARHGLSKLGMSDVSDVAGVSRGSLYRYFPNREELLVALARREGGRFLDRVLEAALAAPEGEERLVVVLEIATQEVRQHPALQRLLESDPAFVLESLRAQFPAISAQLREPFEPLLRDTRAVRSGVITVDQLMDWTTRFLISMYLFEDPEPRRMAESLTAMYRLMRFDNAEGKA